MRAKFAIIATAIAAAGLTCAVVSAGQCKLGSHKLQVVFGPQLHNDALLHPRSQRHITFTSKPTFTKTTSAYEGGVICYPDSGTAKFDVENMSWMKKQATNHCYAVPSPLPFLHYKVLYVSEKNNELIQCKFEATL